MAQLTTQQTGKCGELLVQYRLLKRGIESAPMTTDTGIDLVAFPSVGSVPGGSPAPFTLQVKTTSSGDGPSISDEGVLWAVAWPPLATYIALVDMRRDKLWLFSPSDYKSESTKAGDGLRVGWNVNMQGKRNEREYEAWEWDTAISRLLGDVTGEC